MRYINDAMKKNDTPKDGLINRIIELEWDMFDKVTNTGGRAACQDDEWTFYVMRFSQFSALSEAMLQSYEQDLLQAQREGRNMVTEKYGYMMEYTDPAYFDKQLKPALPQVSPAKEELVDRIANLLLKKPSTHGIRRFTAKAGLCREQRRETYRFISTL